MLFALYFLRLVVGFEARTVAAIVLAFEKKTSFQRRHGKCTENEEWEQTPENASHLIKVSNRSICFYNDKRKLLSTGFLDCRLLYCRIAYWQNEYF